MTTSPLFDALFIPLRAWLITLLPANTPVVKGYVNDVPQPLGDHVVITPLFEKRLRTNVNTYDDDGSAGGTKNIEQGTEIHIQIDVYGAQAGTWAARISTLFRDESAVTAMAPSVSPLYIDDARNMPLVTGEQKYLQRFASTAVMQYNPVTTITQQFADAAEVGLVEVDTLPEV